MRAQSDSVIFTLLCARQWRTVDFTRKLPGSVWTSLFFALTQLGRGDSCNNERTSLSLLDEEYPTDVSSLGVKQWGLILAGYAPQSVSAGRFLLELTQRTWPTLDSNNEGSFVWIVNSKIVYFSKGRVYRIKFEIGRQRRFELGHQMNRKLELPLNFEFK